MATELIATLDYEYGNIKITVNDPQAEYYYLFRSAITSYPKGEALEKLMRENNYSFVDTTIEQGEVYQYLITTSLTAITIIATSDWITSDFEDIFLSDKNASLRVRFNPKINSFKQIIQEQKIETIGNKFPFFFRNGKLKYREIPLSGLISTEMDEQFFPIEPPFGIQQRISTVSSAFFPLNSREIYYNERKYRQAVEAWLTNGEPKIFRSSSEGNYIVRLMNVSLSPEEKLSRRLYTFSATAYEIAEFNIEALISHNLLALDESKSFSDVANGVYLGKVRSSSKINSITIEKDFTLTLNKFTATKLVGDDDDNQFLIGEIDMLRTPIRLRAPRPPASDTNGGMVQSSEEKNCVSVSNGEMTINDVGLEKIVELFEEEWIIGDVGMQIENDDTPTDTTEDNNLYEVIGQPNVVNKFSITQGIMTLNSASFDKIDWSNYDMSIGGIEKI